MNQHDDQPKACTVRVKAEQPVTFLRLRIERETRFPLNDSSGGSYAATLFGLKCFCDDNRDLNDDLVKLTEGKIIKPAVRRELQARGAPGALGRLRQVNGWTDTPGFVLDGSEDRKDLRIALRISSKKK